MTSEAEQAKRDVLAVHHLALATPGRRFADGREGWQISRGPGQSYIAFGLTEDDAWIWAAKVVDALKRVT